LVLELLQTPREAWNNHSTGARRDVRSAWTSIEASFSARLPAKRLQQCGWLLLFGLAVTLCAKFAFYCIFTRFVPYDDEGFILISLKSFLAGKPLYDEIYSCYQPWFYEFNRLLFGLTGLPVCHDSVRLETVAFWLVASILNCAVTWRLTRGGVLSFAVLIVTMRLLGPFANEPGHPQALSYVLLGCVVLWLTFSDEVTPVVLTLGAGSILGLLILTKLNAGVFAALPVAFVLTLSHKRGFGRGLRAGLLALLLLTPVVLMRSLLVAQAASPVHVLVAGTAAVAIAVLLHRRTPGYDPVLTFAFVFLLILVLIGTNARFRGWLPMFSVFNSALLLSALDCPPARLGWKSLVTGAAALLLSMALICGLVMWHGTTFRGLLNGLVLLPAKQSSVFYLPWFSNWLAPSCAFGGLAAACGYLVAQKRLKEPAWLSWAGAGAKFLFGLWALLASLSGTLIWAQTLPHFWLLPFCWVLIIPPMEGPPTLGRYALLGVAAMQPLLAFPVAASQLAPATALVLVVAAVCLSDAVRFLGSRRSWGPTLCRLRPAAGLAITLPLLLSLHFDTAKLAEYYAGLTPLNLPGARRVRLGAAEAAGYQAIVSRLSSPEVGTFLTMPGMNSFYAWAQKAPPTELNVTTWMTLIDPAGQEAIWRAAQRSTGLRVVRCRPLTELWMQGRSTEGLPLVRHIEENFSVVATFGDYEVMARRQPPL